MRRKRGGERCCAICSTRRYLPLSRLKKREGKPWYCSGACHCAGRSRAARVEVTCTTCGDIRSYRHADMPRSVDQQTLTWVCRSCRTYRTAWALRTCAQEGCGAEIRTRVQVAHEPRLPTYCPLHRTAYFAALWRARICARPGCSTLITRRQRGPFCSLARSNAVTRTGRTYRSEAERLVRTKYDDGVRGVRALAEAAGVCENTVRKVLRAGRFSSDRTIATSVPTPILGGE